VTPFPSTAIHKSRISNITENSKKLGVRGSENKRRLTEVVDVEVYRYFANRLHPLYTHFSATELSPSRII
jgi:hypothetical protein